MHKPRQTKAIGAGADRRPWALLALATLIALALRLFRLDRQPLWIDEIASLGNARAFATGGLEGIAQIDQVAPLHSIILWLATTLGGDGEVSLRLPSAIAGVAIVPLVYLLTLRLLRSPWTAGIAAMLVAISPFAIWYAQEARMYVFVMLCTLIVAMLSWPLRRRPLRWHELLAITLISACGYGMHHYMILMTGAFGLFLIVEGLALKSRTWAWLGTQALAFFVCLAWLYLTRDRLASAGSEKPMILLWIPYTFYTYLGGFSFGPSTRDLQHGGAMMQQSLIAHAPAIAALAIGAAAPLVMGLRRVLRPDMRQVGRWLLIWLISPMIVVLIASQVTKIAYNVRYVILCFPPFVVLLAIGIAEAGRAVRAWRNMVSEGPRKRPLAAIGTLAASAVLTACMLWSDFNHYTDWRYAKEDVRSAVPLLNRLPADTLIVTDNNRVVDLLRYYGSKRLPGETVQVDYRFPWFDVQHIWKNFTELSPELRCDVALVEFRSWETDPAGYLRGNIERGYRRISSDTFNGIAITRFRNCP